MTRYAIIDVSNLFYRARHTCQGDPYTKVGMAMNTVFQSLRKIYRETKVDHMVFSFDSLSWRYSAYPQYKESRKLKRLNGTKDDLEEDAAFKVAMSDFSKFMVEKTRCTSLIQDRIEGDDFIARWIQLHPADEHVIISGDSDFIQLLAPNVSIYNGIEDRTIYHDHVVDGKGNHLAFNVEPSSGKIKIIGKIDDLKKKYITEQKQLKKQNPDHSISDFDFHPEDDWCKKALFIKIVRGDSGDGIFSCNPGVRYAGSNKKVGIREAWEDRSGQGYNWNNFMLQQWEKLVGFDDNGQPIKKSVRVIDEFKFNESLIDLTKQPEDIKELMDATIVDAVQKPQVSNVGIHFLKFCNKYDLPLLARNANDHAEYLNRGYML